MGRQSLMRVETDIAIPFRPCGSDVDGPPITFGRGRWLITGSGNKRAVSLWLKLVQKCRIAELHVEGKPCRSPEFENRVLTTCCVLAPRPDHIIYSQ